MVFQQLCQKEGKKNCGWNRNPILYLTCLFFQNPFTNPSFNSKAIQSSNPIGKKLLFFRNFFFFYKFFFFFWYLLRGCLLFPPDVLLAAQKKSPIWPVLLCEINPKLASSVGQPQKVQSPPDFSDGIGSCGLGRTIADFLRVRDTLFHFHSKGKGDKIILSVVHRQCWL